MTDQGAPTGEGPGELVIKGRAAVALERLMAGTATDPNLRRTPKAAKYHKEALTESTRNAYRPWIKQYLYFCSCTGRNESRFTAMDLEHFMVWVAELQPQRGRNAAKSAGMAPNTMRKALAAVHAFCDAMNESWPSTRLAQKIIEGHENIRRDQHNIRDGEGVPPIKLPTLLELLRACPTDTNAGKRDRALLGVAFQIMARRAEMTYIDFDSWQVADQGLRLYIPKTKTSKNGRVAAVVPWADYPDVDPVAAVHAWREACHAVGITSGPFFRGVDQWGHINGSGPYSGGSRHRGIRMSPETVELVVARAAAQAIGMGATIDNAAELHPHSLRSGGATSAYEAGADILSISRQGGWADKSTVIFRYIREVDLWKRNPMKLVGNQEPGVVAQ